MPPAFTAPRTRSSERSGRGRALTEESGTHAEECGRHVGRVEVEIEQDVVDHGDQRVSLLLKPGGDAAVPEPRKKGFGKLGMLAQPALGRRVGEGEVEPEERRIGISRGRERLRGRVGIDGRGGPARLEVVTPDEAIPVRAEARVYRVVQCAAGHCNSLL